MALLPPPARRARSVVVNGLAILAVSVAASTVPPSLAGTAPSGSPAGDPPATVSAPPDAPGQPPVRGETDGDVSGRAEGHWPGEAGGAIPDGETVSVSDEGRPAVGRLDPDLLDALRRSARHAAGDGVELRVTSGWRSRAYQQQLWRDALAEHGSQREAARWVATPERSAHVSGEAVDIGPSEATVWLSEHGGAHGLCQIYRNEPWHYELRPDAVADGCPRMYADPTEDPRMRQ